MNFNTGDYVRHPAERDRLYHLVQNQMTIIGKQTQSWLAEVCDTNGAVLKGQGHSGDGRSPKHYAYYYIDGNLYELAHRAKPITYESFMGVE